MDITFEIIAYALSKDTTLYTNIAMDGEHVVHCFDVWENGLPQTDCLYVLDKEAFLQDPSFWNHKCVICRGKIEQDMLTKQKALCVCVSDRLSIHEIVMQLQQIFHKFYQWMLQTERMAAQGEPLSQLLDYMEESWEIRGGVANRAMRMLGYTDSFQEAHAWVEDHDTVALQTVNELLVDEDFQEASDNTQVFLYMDEDSNWYYCYNFFVADRYEARLLMDVAEGKNYGLAKLVESFGQCIQPYFQRNYGADQSEGSRKQIKRLMRELLEGKKVSRGELQRILLDFHWEPNHNYRLLLFQFQEGAKAGIGQSYYRYQLELLFAGSLVLETARDYICLQNMSLIKAGEDADKNLPYFLRETLCKVGISRTFNDFENLKNYLIEAEQALLLGNRVHPMRWNYRFEDYVMEYMMEQCIQELNPQEVSHPALAILEMYDQKNDTHLLETLKVFLQQRHNVTHTAQLLYIHRTSLLFRLERIKQLTDLDLDEYKTCLHLMLSFELHALIK